METFHKQNNTNNIDILIQEAYGLDVLRTAIVTNKNRYIKIPEVVSVSQEELVLEKIDTNESTRDLSINLGVGLALLHRNFNDKFGFHRDNYIGVSKQINSLCEKWGDFFVQYRLAYQIELIKDEKIKVKFRDILENSKTNLIDFLNNSCDKPSLVHGDLWGGNILYSKENVYLIDPAVYYGDREVDIAMTRMFISGFNDVFYDYYDRTYPLSAEYNKKETIYNLYHYLNHYNMFGNEYLNSCINGFTFIKEFK